jgi:hypothetical protein
MTNTFKPEKAPNAVSADVSRRSFFLKVGAGVSTALASTAVMAQAASGDADDSAMQVALLEEERALRKLHQAFEQAMDKGLYDEVIDMFADDAQVLFNGGVFDHRSQGVSRLYRGRFRSGKTGKRMEPAPGFELAADRQQDSVEVSADRLSAKAVFPYSIQVGIPIETDSSLAGMARLHGEGVQTWWEGGVYHVSYRKEAVDGRWKISRLEYDTLSRADWRSGRTYAMPISVPPISTSYPEDPHGPDALIRAS